VPIIPSMKLVDLFESLVPGAIKNIIGIRAGEKLHEYLLTEEESRHGYRVKNYFVILPSDRLLYPLTRYKKLLDGAKKLPVDFSFGSHNNEKWLTKNELLKLVSDNNGF